MGLDERTFGPVKAGEQTSERQCPKVHVAPGLGDPAGERAVDTGGVERGADVVADVLGIAERVAGLRVVVGEPAR